MTPREQVVFEIARLRRVAASVHVNFPPAEATWEQVARFARDAGVTVGDDLSEFSRAGEGFVLMTPATGRTVFVATPFQSAAREWFGYDREVTMHLGPKAGQVVNVHVTGSGAGGLVSLGTDGSGDGLDLALRDGPHARAGEVVYFDHELDTRTLVARNLAALLRASNDMIEADVDRAFFYGDAVSRIFHFPGTDELRRQLDAGLSPDHAWHYGAYNLLGESLDRRRDDVFLALLERGADLNVALTESAQHRRLDLAELALQRGADPGVRLKDGPTLLAWAALGSRPRTVALLMRFGARRRLGEEAFTRIVEEVRASAKIADRKKRDVLEALAG